MYGNAARDDLWSKLSQVTLSCVAQRRPGRAVTQGVQPATVPHSDLEGIKAARLTEALNYLTKQF